MVSDSEWCRTILTLFQMLRMVRECMVVQRNFLVVRRSRGVPLAPAKDEYVARSYITITTITTI